MEKEGGVLARDAGAGGSEAGEKADGSVVRAMLEAWGWAGLGGAGSRHGVPKRGVNRGIRRFVSGTSNEIEGAHCTTG